MNQSNYLNVNGYGKAMKVQRDPSSIYSISASYLGHCRMNGFGMTYCFGSLGGRQKRRFASKNIDSEFPLGQTAVSAFLITHPKNGVILNSSFLIINLKSQNTERMNEGSPSC